MKVMFFNRRPNGSVLRIDTEREFYELTVLPRIGETFIVYTPPTAWVRTSFRVVNVIHQLTDDTVSVIGEEEIDE